MFQSRELCTLIEICLALNDDKDEGLFGLQELLQTALVFPCCKFWI